ncbi:M48 family metallopeptidase [Thiomicrorhabdus sp. zzn3]|uniref:M48 family metallopeptidase n=1 Tax=Thiomicrorhabdus sp. zzn3 TaxID=3039775 RepID=UPI0024364929|nr:M48 family metallopeptidase [Thiomicrorhabdus sp. zzn3]MDG6778541.1 M48 family metallopeptidase [Thiomicrorhabdus sp. zzn3]
MNFYISQDRARKATRWLVLSYLVALAALACVSSWVLLILLRVIGLAHGPTSEAFYRLTPEDLWLFVGVTVFVVGGALISSYLKARELSKGGRVVASALGGRKLQPNSRNFYERRAQNVVEEMAIASGMPVPEVYLLPDETAINAFAAGLTPNDAVIGLTQGCIEKLNRAQLQGVVGHEFSHILNGDMRLNIRLMMLISGIEFVGVIGRIFTQSSRSSRRFSSRRSRGKGGGAVVLAGLVLRLLGWIGVLFGRLIQAAVSRQREYLADASAVQFTRNPDAVANALKVIGGEMQGSRLKNTDALEAAHLFFGQTFKTHFNLLFATHPPLEDRIRELQPMWDGQFLPPAKPIEVQSSSQPGERKSQGGADQSEAAIAMLATLGTVLGDDASSDSENWRQAIDEPTEVVALILALLVQRQPENLIELNAVFAEIDDASWLAALKPVMQKWPSRLSQLREDHSLLVVELAMPALKNLSQTQYLQFKQALDAIMQFDGQRDLYEQTLYRLVTRVLDVHFGLAKPYRVRYRKLAAVSVEVQLLLSMLAYYGHDLADPHQRQVAHRAYALGMETAGLHPGDMAEISVYQDQDFSRASDKLALCSPELKDRILQAMLACAEYDGKVSEVERELVTALAATVDMPLPRWR